MAFEVKMPKFGETMTEGTIYNWLKDEGEEVQEGEPLFEIETDKATLDVEAPADGILAKILVDEAESALIGDVVALITEEGEEIKDTAENQEKNEDTSDKIKLQVDKNEGKNSTNEEEITNDIQATGDKINIEDKIKASPAARKIASDHNIDLSLVEPENEVIVKKDINEYIQNQPQNNTLSSTAKEQPLNKIKKITAEKMSKSSRETPHVTLTARVNMENIISLRADIQDKTEEHITYTDLITMLTAKTIKNNPEINAVFKDGKLYYKENINIGIAVDTEKGLVVPVIKNADRYGLEELAAKRRILIDRARNGKLTSDDIEGGTFTISNLGSYGIETFTPIINPGEAAILGVGAITEEPCAVNGKIEIKPRLWLSLSFDHRVIDGGPAAHILNNIKELMAEPAKLLLYS